MRKIVSIAALAAWGVCLASNSPAQQRFVPRLTSEASALGSRAAAIATLSAAPLMSAPSLSAAPLFFAAAAPLAAASAPASARPAPARAPAKAADGAKAGAASAVGKDGSVNWDAASAPAPSAAAVAPPARWKQAKISKIHATQKNVGMIEVGEKYKKLRAMTREEAERHIENDKNGEYLIPVVVGPAKKKGGKKRLFAIDHHHEMLAARKRGLKRIGTAKAADLSADADGNPLSEKEFWAEMRARKWVLLRSLGRPIEPSDLPENVDGLKNDFYRSVAGAVRNAGGYRKNSAPFSEFDWADYFRTYAKVPPKKRNFKKAVAEALRLAKLDQAKDLPGYIGPK